MCSPVKKKIHYLDNGTVMMWVEPLPRKDLTKNQIGWCRAHIPMFAEMQRLRGVK